MKGRITINLERERAERLELLIATFLDRNNQEAMMDINLIKSDLDIIQCKLWNALHSNQNVDF